MVGTSLLKQYILRRRRIQILSSILKWKIPAGVPLSGCRGEPVHFHISSGKEFSNMSGYGTIDTYDRKDERERNYEADRT